MSGSDVHDMSYYKKCMMGGILSCGITHAIVCPLDIVKCRMQVRKLKSFFLQLFQYLGHARTLLRCWRWFQTNHESRRTNGFLSRKYNIQMLFNNLFYRVSSQHGSVILSKVSVNSVSMKCSRTSTEVLAEMMRKPSRNIKPSVSLFHLPVPKSLLTSSSAHGKL